MRLFLNILFLIFILESWSKADDVKDLQIEGISIGDSLLNFFDNKEIRGSLVKSYKSDKYLEAEFSNLKEFKIYDALLINFLKDDKQKTISAIHGIKEYDDIENCLNKKKEISLEVESLFNNVSIDKRDKAKHFGDKTGKSFTFDHYITLENNDIVSISCYDWSKESGLIDHLRISIVTSEFLYWINNEAYN